MDALERVKALRSDFKASDWSEVAYMRAAVEGKHRWKQAEELFGIEYAMFGDSVARIDPHFELPSPELSVAEASDVRVRRNVDNRIAVWFAKWARCPSTTGFPNPYEPWIEIWENGGSFSVEHGQFVDVFGQDGMPVGAVVVRRA